MTAGSELHLDRVLGQRAGGDRTYARAHQACAERCLSHCAGRVTGTPSRSRRSDGLTRSRCGGDHGRGSLGSEPSTCACVKPGMGCADGWQRARLSGSRREDVRRPFQKLVGDLHGGSRAPRRRRCRFLGAGIASPAAGIDRVHLPSFSHDDCAAQGRGDWERGDRHPIFNHRRPKGSGPDCRHPLETRRRLLHQARGAVGCNRA